MMDWNVVITVNEGGFRKAFDTLGEFGVVKRSEFLNVLVMKSDNINKMLENIAANSMNHNEYLTFLSRLIPVTETFSFQNHEEFRIRSGKAVLTWLSELGGRTFHVRMHRRGFKGKISSQEEEQFLDYALLENLANRKTPGSITFDDPDAVIAVETVANRAGMSLWTREQMERYPFIRPD